MTVAEIATEFEAEQGARRVLNQVQICLAAEVFVAALRRIESREPRRRIVYRYGLRIVISALEEYQARQCGRYR